MPSATDGNAGRSAALVINPAAGTARLDGAGVDALVTDLERAGFRMAPPCLSLGVDEQIDAALATAPDVVFTVGGDGTLRAVAERLIGTPSALGVLPGGTMNRMAVRLGIPSAPAAAIRALAAGSREMVPVGELNGEVFLYQSLVGKPARLVRFREMQRGAGMFGWLPLLLAALRSLGRPARRSLRLRGSGRSNRADAVVITLPQPGQEALFDVVAVRRRGLLGGLRQGWRWITGNLSRDAGAVAFQRTHLAVLGSSRGVRVTLDGEQRLVAPPLRFRLRDGALCVLRPRP